MITSHTFVRLLLAAWLLPLSLAPAWAEGTLTHLSGPVAVQKPDGKTVRGGIGTQVSAGDTVVTGAGGFARIEMTDGGEMVLRPDSQLQVDSYTYSQAKPAEDNFVFSMLKGGLRTVTGLIGKRGNRDAYKLRTATATIGIRGTQFDLRVCQANCGAMADGTYVAVRFGAVQTSNAQGSLAVAAGQVGHVPPQRPPVILPRDPGVGFTPPAVIPKLDEKKKVQAAATAAAANTPDPAKPATSGSGQSTQTSRGGSKATSGSTSSGSGEGSKADDPGKPDGAGKADGASKTESTGTGSASASKEGSSPDAGGKTGAQGSSATTPSQAGGSTATPPTAPATQSSAPVSPVVETAAPLLFNANTSPTGAGPECSVQ